jgi:hypothetical protein
MRSNGCGDLRKQQIDDQVQLTAAGWTVAVITVG